MEIRAGIEENEAEKPVASLPMTFRKVKKVEVVG